MDDWTGAHVWMSAWPILGAYVFTTALSFVGIRYLATWIRRAADAS